MRFVYKKRGELEPEFFIQLSRAEADLCLRHLHERVCDYNLNVRNHIILHALNLPENVTRYPYSIHEGQIFSQTSREAKKILADAGLDLENLEDREVILKLVKKYLDIRLGEAVLHNVDDERYTQLNLSEVLTTNVKDISSEDFSIATPIMVSINGIIYELKQISQTKDMSQYIRRKVRQAVKKYGKEVGIVAGALEQEYERKSNILREREEKLLPMPMLTMEDVRKGIRVYRTGYYINFLVPARFIINSLSFKEHKYILKKPRQVDGFIDLGIDKDFRIENARALEKDFSPLSHCNVDNHGSICTGDSEIIGKHVENLAGIYTLAESIKLLLRRLNMDSPLNSDITWILKILEDLDAHTIPEEEYRASIWSSSREVEARVRRMEEERRREMEEEMEAEMEAEEEEREEEEGREL